MKTAEPVAAMEIGTTYTTMAVGEPLTGGCVRILRLEKITSSGVHKSIVTDIKQAVFSINGVLKRIEENGPNNRNGYTITNAAIAVSGPHIRTKKITTGTQLNGDVVTDADIAHVYNTYVTGIGDDRTELENIEADYSLDGMGGITSPIGLSGGMLSLNSICIHGDEHRTKDIRTAASNAKLEITDMAFAGTCAASAVLTPQDTRNGVIVIDLGGGSTSYLVYSGGHLSYTSVLGVGGDNVTNDVAQAFSLQRSQAEAVKKQSASAVIAADDTGKRVTVPSQNPAFEDRDFSQKALNTVVNARMHELFTLIRDDLDKNNLIHVIHGGVILTGGGSALKGVTELASTVFGVPARIGTLVPEIQGMPQGVDGAANATVVGLVLRLARQTQPKRSLVENIVALTKGIFRK